MLTVFAILGFAGAAMMASSLIYTPHAWRYALGAALLCALVAIAGVADSLLALGRYFAGGIGHGLALALAALPFSAALVRLCIRRRDTPRHTPGPDDDPVYRRYRQEKIRRRRLQRQREEELERHDESVDSV